MAAQQLLEVGLLEFAPDNVEVTKLI